MSENNSKQYSQEADLLNEDNKLILLRREKLARIREMRNAFPNNFKRNALADDLQKQLADKSKEELAEINKSVSIAGRIMTKRGPFLLLQDMSGRIQAYIDGISAT